MNLGIPPQTAAGREMPTVARANIDAHVHFWDLEKFQYVWPTEENGPLFDNFFPCGYEKALVESGCNVKNGIFVQVVNNTVAETDWVLDMATRHKCIVGVVGWIDMCGTDDEVDKELQRLAKNPLFLGLRHILDLEEPGWIEKKEVKRTLGRLEKLNMTYDLLLRPHSLHYAADIAQEFPNLRLIIDHLAKPKIRDGEFGDWSKEMSRAASCPNVFVKLSGLVTEADPTCWTPSDLKPYVQHCVKSFGAQRCIFGSDYPVFKVVGATYKQVYDALMDCLLDCTTVEERGNIFGENAVRFYQVKVPLQE